ncbi:UBP-type zinc finger domain-containing protein [Algoriphagus pacificus]|uniref:UBP-type zinc finger domain-containing protein n=1 Tax=Algoriphagus pacificus TaxID=2811234 RepID=A0ABS3CGI9_9BACT|nr:UBP-type zinc finger domain-containing protein [Algoriphagus pacificus]MBN7816215.1 UBP-type zinc finger domain-containing protein [Algoriphagus pacificus]
MRFGSCEHLDNYENKDPKAYECEECVKTGDRWVHLRTCQECGVTLCCDSSPNQHASAHARKMNHPVIKSAELGEDWAYCFIHEALLTKG